MLLSTDTGISLRRRIFLYLNHYIFGLLLSIFLPVWRANNIILILYIIIIIIAMAIIIIILFFDLILLLIWILFSNRILFVFFL